MGTLALRRSPLLLSRIAMSSSFICSASAAVSFSSIVCCRIPKFSLPGACFLHDRSPWSQKSNDFSFFSESNSFNSLTDVRYPKRRPLFKPRRKRASLRRSGPYAWVIHAPALPIQPNTPNKGSLKRRNEKKRRLKQRAFILAEAKKRKAQLQAARKRKLVKRVDRKMAAAARERDWAQRLEELHQLEEQRKNSPS